MATLIQGRWGGWVTVDNHCVLERLLMAVCMGREALMCGTPDWTADSSVSSVEWQGRRG